MQLRSLFKTPSYRCIFIYISKCIDKDFQISVSRSLQLWLFMEITIYAFKMGYIKKAVDLIKKAQLPKFIIQFSK